MMEESAKIKMLVQPLAPMAERMGMATVEELHGLYRVYLCREMPTFALEMMTERELRKYVAMGAYRAIKAHYPDKNRRLIEHIALCTGVAASSIYGWLSDPE